MRTAPRGMDQGGELPDPKLQMHNGSYQLERCAVLCELAWHKRLMATMVTLQARCGPVLVPLNSISYVVGLTTETYSRHRRSRASLTSRENSPPAVLRDAVSC